MNAQNLTKFCKLIIMDKIYLEIFTLQQFFSNRVMPLNVSLTLNHYGGAIVRSSVNSVFWGSYKNSGCYVNL